MRRLIEQPSDKNFACDIRTGTLQFYLLSMLLVVGSFSVCFSWFSSANDHHRDYHHCDHPYFNSNLIWIPGYRTVFARPSYIYTKGWPDDWLASLLACWLAGWLAGWLVEAIETRKYFSNCEN
uniref:Uncharacterized protein n=1 Tax=Glossina brevipalpis TaxID=37001 RepID=A0A1A9W4U7_9MUSC